jgi:hypothetical protein
LQALNIAARSLVPGIQFYKLLAKQLHATTPRFGQIAIRVFMLKAQSNLKFGNREAAKWCDAIAQAKTFLLEYVVRRQSTNLEKKVTENKQLKKRLERDRKSSF